jgi:hypothetical protein
MKPLSPIALQLMEAKSRIVDKKNWCQFGLVKVALDGHLMYCALGALYRAAQEQIALPREHIPAEHFLNIAALKLYADDIMYVNDECGHEAVLQVYDRAIELAGEDAA